VTRILLDTMMLAWVIDWRSVDTRPSKADRDLIDTSTARLVSPISLFEIATKARIGKWPDMEPHIAALESVIEYVGLNLAPIDTGILLDAATLDWDHRDPFDRIITATARHLDVRIVTTDRAILRFQGGAV